MSWLDKIKSILARKEKKIEIEAPARVINFEDIPGLLEEKTKKLKEAYVCFGTIKRFIQFDRMGKLTKICAIARAGRSYGNLNLKFFLEGKADVMLESYGAMHDFAAPAILVTEAGGKFTDFSGKFSLTSGNAVATNGLLHNQVLKILNE